MIFDLERVDWVNWIELIKNLIFRKVGKNLLEIRELIKNLIFRKVGKNLLEICGTLSNIYFLPPCRYHIEQPTTMVVVGKF